MGNMIDGDLLDPIVLTVDDDDDALEVYRHIFERQGYDVLRAYSGSEALDVLAANSSIDVVLLDLRMPGELDGLDVLRKLRSQEATKQIPVLIVTALGSTEQQVAGLDAGADDYITKPFTARALLARVNAALRISRSQRALREAEERYRLLVETARDFVFALDMDGQFTYVSPSVLTLSGYAPDAFFSGERNLLDMIHPDDRARVEEHLELAMRGVSGDDAQFRLIRRDGAERWLSMSWAAIHNAAGQQIGVQSIARDVTSRKQSEAAIYQRSQELVALNRIASRVNQSLDLNVTLADALDALVEALKVDYGLIYITKGEQVTVRAHHNLDETILQRVRMIRLVDAPWLDSLSVYRDWPDASMHPFDEIARTLEARSWLSAPLHERNLLTGAIILGSRRVTGFGDEEVILIRTVADQVGVAVANARLYEETRHRVDELALLNEVSRALTSTLNLDEVLSVIMEEAVNTLQGEAGSVLLLDETRDELKFAASVGPAAERLIDVRMPRDAGIAGQALTSGQPLLISHVQSDRQFYGRIDGLTKMTTRTMVVAPLRTRGRVIGVMEILNKRSESFTRSDLRLLDSLAQSAATAIDNAQLFERERRRVQQLAALDEIGQHMTSSLNAEALLPQAARLICKRLSYVGAEIELVEPNGIDLIVQGVYGSSPSDVNVGDVLPVHEGLIGRAVSEGRSIVVRDIETEPILQGAKVEDADSRNSRLISRLAVPIMLESIVIGMILVESCELDAFNVIDTTTLEAVAVQIGTAIANSRLYKQVRRRNQELSAMHGISAAVSQSLELQNVLDAALVTAQPLFAADGSRIHLIEGGSLILKTGYGRLHEELPAPSREPVDETFIGLAVQRAALEVLSDVSKSESIWRERWRDLPLKSIAAVPLWGHDRVQGVMSLLWREQHEFDERSLQLLVAVGQQIGVAIERARLYEDSLRRENELGALNDIIRSVTSTLDLEQVLSEAMQGVRDVMQVEVGSLLLLDEIDGSLRFRKTIGPAGEYVVDQMLQPGEGVAGWVVTNRKSLRVNKTQEQEDIRYTQGFEQGIDVIVESVMAAPLIVKDRVIGVIEVVNKAGGLSKGDEELLNSLAASVAVAIDNARLYQELADSSEKLARSHMQLVQSEKLAATGRLALSLAHEINNPLQAVANCLHLAFEPNIDDDRRNEFLSMAREEVNRLSRLIQRMLEFYRPSPGDQTSGDVNESIDKTLMLAERKLRRNRIEVSRDLAPDLPQVRIANDQITQVFLNLTINAAEALESGGNLSISSKLDSSGEWVQVTFSDDGPGIPVDALPHVFEPFFTTKTTGSGLGLAVSYGIIDRHSGLLSVESENGKGTTFFVRLPADVKGVAEAPVRALVDSTEHEEAL